MAVLVPIAIAGAPERTVESKAFQIAGQSQDFAKVGCPNGASVTGGGFIIYTTGGSDGRSHVNSLIPTTTNKWTAVLDNSEFAQHDAESDVVCRRDGKISTKSKSADFTTADEQLNTTTAKCPKGSSVTGGGGATSGSYDESWILQSKPKGKRGWSILTYNSTDFLAVTAVAICDKENKYETVKKTETESAMRTNTILVEAEAKCPDGGTTSGGGYALPESGHNDAVLQSFPQGKNKWVAVAKVYGLPSAELTSYAVCRK